MIFKGSGVALITPFTKDGSIDFEKLKELINMHISKKTDAIIVCGTTGESSTLSNDEKKEVIKYCVEVANGRIPIIAGTGSNNTKIAIEMTEYANSVNANGALIVTPYYNKCNQEGLYHHYEQIANSVKDFPIILYNVPSRTCVNLENETIIKLSKIQNIIGIKEANPNISKIASLRQNLPDEFAIYSGNDDLILPILSVGGNGVISVIANILPDEVHNICYNFFESNFKSSQRLYFKILELCKTLFIDINPIMIKECMNILGYNVGNVRLPLSNTSNENIQKIKICLEKLVLLKKEQN